MTIDVGFAEGVTDGVALVGEPGVRLTVSVPLVKLTSIGWGDGHLDIPPDTEGGFVAHIYREPAFAIMVEVTTEDDSGISDPFDVTEPEPANPPSESYEDAVDVGYIGQPPDPAPNEDYTVEGGEEEPPPEVTRKAPPPEERSRRD